MYLFSNGPIRFSLAILFLLGCAFIYVFYRPETTLINIVLNEVVSTDLLSSARSSVSAWLTLPSYIIYSLPGGLWVFAATILSKNLKCKILKFSINVEWLPMSFALWLEFWQFFDIIKGRFDLMDIVFVLVFGFLARLFISGINIPNQYLFQPFNIRSKLFLFVFMIVFMAHVF